MAELVNKAQFTITIDKDLVPDLDRALRDDRRSRSAYVNDLIHKDLAKRRRERKKQEEAAAAEKTAKKSKR